MRESTLENTYDPTRICYLYFVLGIRILEMVDVIRIIFQYFSTLTKKIAGIEPVEIGS